MRDPRRDLPRALTIAMVVTTGIYVLVALSAVSAVDWRELSSSPAPLATVAGRALGPRADTLLSAVALCATANTVLLLLVSAARSTYGMAGAGVLPRVLARISPAGNPTLATAAVLATTALMLLVGDLTAVAALTDAAVLTSFGLVNASLACLALRGRAGGTRGRRVVDLVVSGGAIAMCVALLLHAGTISLIVAAAIAAVGLLVARPRQSAGRAPADDSKERNR